MMTGWSSKGEILRWWRTDVAQVSQSELARRLSVGPSALSNWENGARAISIPFEDVDTGLEANGVLAQLLECFPTPQGLDPQRRWTHVFSQVSTPVWAWVRGEGSVELSGEWGVVRFDESLDLRGNGCFITVPTSVSGSPVVVHASKPVWVEFGRGELPSVIPDAQVTPASRFAKRSSADGPFMQMFLASAAAGIGGAGRVPRSLAAMAFLGPRTIGSILFGYGRLDDGGVPVPLPPSDEGIDSIERERFVRLRRARGLSLVDLTERLSRLTGLEVSKDTLRRFESSVGRPHDPLLPAALDSILGAGGSLAVVPLREARGAGSVMIPLWWYGPLWIDFSSEGSPGHDFRAKIRWADWYRTVRATTPIVVQTQSCFPDHPLQVQVDGSVSWKLGLGNRRGAVSIDQNWVPANVAAAQRSLRIVQDALAHTYEVDTS